MRRPGLGACRARNDRAAADGTMPKGDLLTKRGGRSDPLVSLAESFPASDAPSWVSGIDAQRGSARKQPS